MQRANENRKLVTDEERESHEWILLTRKLRSIGLGEAAARLETALVASRVRSEHDVRQRF